MRGASGASGSSPMCSSTTSDASHSRADVDARVASEPVQRLDERLARDAVQRERQRVDRRRDDVGADARRDERVRERRAARRLDEEADRQPARLAEPLDELLRDVREQPARGSFRSTRDAPSSPSPLRLLDERIRLAGATGAVDEADVELPPGARDRLARLAEVRDVVQRVVQAEDLDAVVGRARDEAAHDVLARRASSRRGSGREARYRAAWWCGH